MASDDVLLKEDKESSARRRLTACVFGDFVENARTFGGNEVADTTKQDADFLGQFEPDVFWQQHGRKVLIGLAAVLVIGAAIYMRQRQSAEQEDSAAGELARAHDASTLQRLAQQYRGKPLALQSLLVLAEQQLRSGQNKEASDTFHQVISEFPTHPFRETAELGLAVAQEAQGDFAGAKEQYQKLQSVHPNGFSSVPARLGAARCAEALGLTKEAQQLYDELRPVIQGSPWENEVYLRWMVLSRTHPPAAAPELPAIPGDVGKQP